MACIDYLQYKVFKMTMEGLEMNSRRGLSNEDKKVGENKIVEVVPQKVNG